MGAAVGLSTLSVCGAGKAGLYLETQVQLLILGGFAQPSPVAFTPPAGFLHPDTPLSSVTSGWPGGCIPKVHFPPEFTWDFFVWHQGLVKTCWRSLYCVDESSQEPFKGLHCCHALDFITSHL